MGRRRKKLLKNTHCEKKCHDTKPEAERMMWQMRKRGHVGIEVYACNMHGKKVFHVGHKMGFGSKR